MASDLNPEQVLNRLKKGETGPVYLFYGEEVFRLEKLLDSFRETCLDEAARDFNLRIFDGDIASPADILDDARSFPFMSSSRLIIVRRVEKFSASDLESFLPYLENPVDTTCLIFVSLKTDFKKKFYKKCREMGVAVHFQSLYDSQVPPWIKKAAGDLGLKMTDEACEYLHGIIGNRLREIHTELEKLHLRHQGQSIGVEEIKESARYSRVYTIFELMDHISSKDRERAVSVLNRFLEEEGKEAAFGIIGMLNRQIRLLLDTGTILEGGGGQADVAKKVKVPPFLVKKIVQQSKKWTLDELERGLHLLHRADGHLKTGSQAHLILEMLVISLLAQPWEAAS